MKRLLKRLAILPAVILFCITPAFLSNTVYASTDRISNTSAQETAVEPTPAVYADAALHSTITFNSTGNFSTTAPASLKNTITGSAAVAEILEESFRRRFAQYSFYRRNLLLRLRVREIIFPFHYFW